MKKGVGSRTALMTAYVRGYHALHDEPKIFDDAIGYRLVPEEARNALKQHLIKTASQMAPERAGECIDDEATLRLGVHIMAGSILARARYVEDRLEKAVKTKDVKQYVILGAGLDTFAFRQPVWAEGVKVFEIDHPSTQEGKRTELKQAGMQEPDNLYFIPIDFTSETLTSALKRSKYDPQSPSFFCWTGVTHYLPLEAIKATLSDIVNLSPKGSEVVFDYWDHLAFDPAAASSRVKSLIETTKIIGEPIITGFDPANLEHVLAPLGLRLVDNLGPAEIREKYHLEDIGYTTSQHVHFACAEV